jgi:hypothetical protein
VNGLKNSNILKIKRLFEKLDKLESKIFLVGTGSIETDLEDIYIFEKLGRKIEKLAYDINSLFYIADYILSENGFNIKRVYIELLSKDLRGGFIESYIDKSVSAVIDEALGNCMSQFEMFKNRAMDNDLDYFEIPIEENINVDKFTKDEHNLNSLINCFNQTIEILESYADILLKLERFMKVNNINKSVITSIKEGLL